MQQSEVKPLAHTDKEIDPPKRKGTDVKAKVTKRGMESSCKSLGP